MNSVVRSPLVGEVIPPGEGAEVVLALHPLKIEHERITVPAGMSIAEIVDLAKARSTSRLPRTLMASFDDGYWIPKQRWPRIRLKPGAKLIIRAVPAGDILRSVLILAVALVAPYIGAFLAPILGISAGIIGAAVTIGGALLVNALFPVRPPKLDSEQPSPTYSIGGGRNQAAPFGPVPVILGRHRVSPHYGAVPFTEFLGDDQYLRMLFVFGYGPLTIEDIRIGETPIGDFEDVTIQIRNGYATDSAPTLYPEQVIQQDLSIDLKHEDGWHQRTTAEDINEISVDVMAPQGIYRLNDEGKRKTRTATVKVQYRVAESNAAWRDLGTLTFSARSSDAIRRGISRNVSKGQYEVRVSKTSGDAEEKDNVIETLVWSALRGIRHAPPISFDKPLALLAIRIRATSQLNGVIDTLNAVVTSRVRAFNGSAWISNTPSRNPADHFYHVLHDAPANAERVPNARIDLETIQEWHTYCKNEGFTFDMVRDFTSSVYELLADIAAAGRAAVLFRDGKWSVVWDDSSAPVVQHFTPRNSWGFAGNRQYRLLPHAWRVRFINEDAGWQQDERIVYDDGYNASNATRFEGIEFPGVTDSKLVWRHGRFHIAQARLRPEVYSLSVDAEHLVATRGDRVRVTHDVPMWGIAAGRVKSISGQVITLDDAVLMTATTAYVIRFRLSDGTSLLRNVTSEAGEHTQITLSGPGAVPQPGNLFMFGEAGSESITLRVRSISPAEDLSAKLTLVDDAPQISQADTGTIPEFDSRITIPPNPYTLGPINLLIEERATALGDNIIPAVIFSWSSPAASHPVRYQVQMRDDTSNDIWVWVTGTLEAPTSFVRIEGLEAGRRSFRVRSIFEDGTFSQWSNLIGQVLLGLDNAPTDVEGFVISTLGDIATLSWFPVSTVGVSHYVIRYSPSLVGVTWGSATVLRERVDGTSVQVPAMIGTYLIKAVSVAGFESINPSTIVSNVAGLLKLNVVETYQAEPDWDGTKEHVEVDGVTLRLSQVGTMFGWPLINTLTPEHWTTQFPWEFGLFESSDIIDLGEVFTSRVSVQIDAVGDNIDNGIGNWGALGSLGPIGGDNADQWLVRVFARYTSDDPNGVDPEWSEYHEIVVSDITARAFGPFRIQLYSLAPGITPVVLSAKVIIDMPDRVIADDNLVSDAMEAVRVDFAPPFRHLEGVGIAIEDGDTGDYYEIANKDETGFDIQFFNSSAAGVARTFDYVAKGYGALISA